MKRILIFASFFICTFNSKAQQKLTKEEILSSWNYPEKSLKSRDLVSFSFSTDVSNRTRYIIDSLEHQKIDSVLIYSKHYPGSFLINKPCFTISHSEYTYIFWKSNDSIKLKALAGNCEKDTFFLGSIDIITYLGVQKSKISSECVMPVIFEAYREKNNIVKYSMSTIDHEPNYSIIFKIDKMYKIVSFAESYLENKKSIFWDYNLNLKSIELWNMLQKLTNPFSGGW